MVTTAGLWSPESPQLDHDFERFALAQAMRVAMPGWDCFDLRRTPITSSPGMATVADGLDGHSA
jgi:hypothetical protein